MNLKIKDELYYNDLIADLKQILKIEKITDINQIIRINHRKEKVLIQNKNGNLTYKSSDYSIEINKIIKEICDRTIDINDSTSHNKVNEIIKDIENKEIENMILINLLSTINIMGQLSSFSLGESKEQCVCLNKNNKIWEVYLVERGIIYDKSTFKECADACIEVIRQLAESKNLFQEHKEIFLKKKINFRKIIII